MTPVQPAAQGPHRIDGDRWRFRVWAPEAERVDLLLPGRAVPMEREDFGYHAVVVEDGPGTRYRYALPNGERADPASRSQPDGVHGPSEVIDLTAFGWSDDRWRGVELRDLVIMEIHVGTFTPRGTFDGVAERLYDLRELGVTAIEIMPVAQFPGARNWGYDGAFPYATQDTYGGPLGLMRLVDAAHRAGLAVILDVVYNHIGPEGAVLADYGPYFTPRYSTPWGQAVNVDGPGSDEVRRYLIDNALMWLTDFHIDALRLDAVHGIFDMSPYLFLAQLADEVHERAETLGIPKLLIAESDTNDARMISARANGGIGMDAVWSDDFHHAVHTIVTGEDAGYYVDYGTTDLLARSMRHGFAYQGEYSPYRGRRHGSSAEGLSAERFVVCIQNHDQVGNRAFGERLSALVPFERLKLAAGLLLTSPFVPLLFMGEEYAEDAPFLYFVSHTDPDLVEAVRTGRREEFAAFEWTVEPPDPASEDTFARCVLTHARDGNHGHLRALYSELLMLRRERPALATGNKENVSVRFDEDSGAFELRRHAGGDEVLALFALGKDAAVFSMPGTPPHVVLDAADERFGGGEASEISGGNIRVPASSFVIVEVPR